MFQLLFSGFFASSLHVISGPDHLAAVTPLAISTRGKAWKIGAFWALGHLLGMVLIGVLFLFLRQIFPLEKFSAHSEQLVGFILIGIGIWSFYKIFSENKSHHHSHQGHSHAETTKNHLPSFFVGVIHGFAGISHFILLLPMIGLKTASQSIIYFVGFALGIVFSMLIFSSIIGFIGNLTKKEKHQSLHKKVRILGGAFAIIIGFYWIFDTF